MVFLPKNNSSKRGHRHRTRVFIPRSLPHFKPSTPIVGVRIHAEGPSHLEGIRFVNFRHNEYRKSAAIAWADKYNFHNGVTSSAKGLSFDWNVSFFYFPDFTAYFETMHS